MKVDERLIMVGSYLVAFFICWILAVAFRRKIYGNNLEYDERQERIRGLAYKWGFFTLLIGISVNAIVKEILNIEWATPIAEFSVLLGISIIIVTGICIFKDAYFAPFAKEKNIIWISFVIGLINLYSGIEQILTHQSLDEFHRFSNNQIVIGIVLMIIPIMAISHKIMMERGGDE